MAVAHRTTVEATGKTATVLRVPAEVVAAVDGDWIDEAKRPETRQRRIAGTVEPILAGTTQR